MLRSKYRRLLIWIGVAYLAVIGLVLYPALHEGLGLRIFVWNCLPPSVGLILVLTAINESKSRVVGSAAFAVLAALGAIFFFMAWFLTPLDTDPHSVTTKFVFVFGPLYSLGVALIGSGIGWLVVRTIS